MDNGHPRAYNALWLGLTLILVSCLLASCRAQVTNTSTTATVTPVARSLLPTFTAVEPTMPAATSTLYPISLCPSVVA